MKTNAKGLALIKRFEGCKLDAYLCPAGRWTIGYGHTGDVKPGHRITQHQADVILAFDLERFEEAVAHALRGVSVTENQFSACVALAFNIGPTAFVNSSVCKRILRGDTTGAANAFLLWNKAGGQILPGLITRRAAERALFLT